MFFLTFPKMYQNCTIFQIPKDPGSTPNKLKKILKKYKYLYLFYDKIMLNLSNACTDKMTVKDCDLDQILKLRLKIKVPIDRSEMHVNAWVWSAHIARFNKVSLLPLPNYPLATVLEGI